MKRNVIEIEGRKIRDRASFYNEIERQLTFDLNWKIGRNLNAFADVLLGGFGRHYYMEEIDLKWLNYKSSERNLKPEFLEGILEMIDSIENVRLVKY